MPAESRNNTINPEVMLGIQLLKESQLMISKLKQLKLDDLSAPCMAVFGDNGNQTAILFGTVADRVTRIKKHLVISPKGFFLAESGTEAAPDYDVLSKTLKLVPAPTVSLEQNQMKQYIRIKISQENNYHSFKLKRIEDAPEEFAALLKSAIESSREVAQKPLLEEMGRGRAGNDLLDNMLREQSLSASAVPPPPGAQTA